MRSTVRVFLAVAGCWPNEEEVINAEMRKVARNAEKQETRRHKGMRSSRERTLVLAGVGRRTNSEQRLTRWPAEITSTEQMQMQMKDRLAGAGAVIQDRAIAREDLAFARKLRSNQLQLSKYGLIFGGGFGQRLKMLARANQD